MGGIYYVLMHGLVTTAKGIQKLSSPSTIHLQFSCRVQSFFFQPTQGTIVSPTKFYLKNTLKDIILGNTITW